MFWNFILIENSCFMVKVDFLSFAVACVIHWAKVFFVSSIYFIDQSHDNETTAAQAKCIKIIVPHANKTQEEKKGQLFMCLLLLSSSSSLFTRWQLKRNWVKDYLWMQLITFSISFPSFKKFKSTRARGQIKLEHLSIVQFCFSLQNKMRRETLGTLQSCFWAFCEIKIRSIFYFSSHTVINSN